MNQAQRRILVLSLVILLLLSVLYFLFFSKLGEGLLGQPATPTPTYSTVSEALENLPTPTPTPSPPPTATPTPTASPAPTASPTPDKVASLKKGSKGTEVVALQARLIELGYLAAGSNDGDYGSKTADAVKAFQQVNKLKTDGVAGQETLTRLYSQDALPKP